MRNGLRPPVVSTQAENGIRKSDPDKDGAAIKRPSSVGLKNINSLNRNAIGEKTATAENPKKNAVVAANKLRLPVESWFIGLIQ
jgi:hypothetical protein